MRTTALHLALNMAFLLVSFHLAACGDNIDNTTVNQMGMEVVASEDDLPKCNDDNEGEQAFVKGETSARICVDGDWVLLNGAGDFSCTTKELKDKSGLKIICNGDSIGVVLNGKDGKKGEKGESGKNGEEGSGCTFTQNDTSVTVICGDDTTTIKLGSSTASADTSVKDSDDVEVSLDSLAGHSQKGPFLRGSTVYLYELDNGKTLKQTNGNFTSYITRDDGYFKFTARNLVSPYALVIVDGNYRNEVTGGISQQPIRLKALSDVRKHHKGANVNILTHLEYEYVYNLVTRDEMNFAAAKKKAQEAVFKAFGFDVKSSEDAETLDIFGTTEADAALLAMSILLQGARSEAEMMALLSEISDEIAIEGKWDSERSDTIRAQLADWAFGQNMYKFRTNVEGWELNGSEKIGDFEKYINSFIASIYGIDTCAAESDTTQTIKNPLSIFNGRTYRCFQRKGDIKLPQATWIDIRSQEYLNQDKLEYGCCYSSMIDWRDRRMYATTIYPTMKKIVIYGFAENLDYEYRVNGKPYGSYCYFDMCDAFKAYGRLYTWGAAMDSAGVFSSDAHNCGYGNECAASSQVRGICPEGWHIPSKSEWDDLLAGIEENRGGGTAATMLKSQKGWDPAGEDSDGFSAIPAGFRYVGAKTHGDNTHVYAEPYREFGREADFWSSTETNAAFAYSLELDSAAKTTDHSSYKHYGYSIRCIQD